MRNRPQTVNDFPKKGRWGHIMPVLLYWDLMIIPYFSLTRETHVFHRPSSKHLKDSNLNITAASISWGAHYICYQISRFKLNQSLSDKDSVMQKK